MSYPFHGPSRNEPMRSNALSYDEYQSWLDSNVELPSGPGSITWRVNGEMILVLGWARAVLMQIAHPLVAEGVACHTQFRNSVQAKVERFHRTLNRMLRLTFGTPHEVWKAAAGIDAIHGRVYGEGYSARDPELLKWVHATFIDSMHRTYALYIGPLTRAQRDDYVYKASIVGPLLGAPKGFFPENAAELDAYIEYMLGSGVLKVGPEARELAAYVLDGLPLPVIGRLIGWGVTLPTAALLPDPLREAYALTHSPLDSLILQTSAFASRALHQILPNQLHRWPLATRAEQNQQTLP